jgi:hypothetical protein
MVVRLLLLAIVVNSVVTPPVASAASGAPAIGQSSAASECLCAGCETDRDEVTRPIEHVLPDLPSARAFAALSDPSTEEHVRPPLRPPMAR